jgi:hypothetical protein
MILRVTLLAASFVIRPKRLPFLVAHHLGQRQSRQNDCAVGKTRDAAQQCCDRRSGGRQPGGDSETGQWLPLPTPRGGPQQPVTAVGQVDRAAPGKLRRPCFDNRLHAVERRLPVSGKLDRFGARLLQSGRLNFLDGQRVERSSEVGGEPHRFRRAFAAAPHDPGQRKVSDKRIDCRRNGGFLVRRVECAADSVVELGIAHRDQARQHQASPARPHERLGQRAHRAVVGEQDASPGQHQPVAAMAGNQAGGERIGEASVRRDGEDVGGSSSLTHGPAPPRCRGSIAASRHQTTGPGEPARSSDSRQSRGPTGYWWRMLLPVRPRAGAWRSSGCR